MKRTQAHTPSQSSTPSWTEVQVYLNRGSRLRAETVGDLLSITARGVGRLFRRRDPDQAPRQTIRLAGDAPARGLVNLFIPVESWVRNEGRIVLTAVPDERPGQPGQPGQPEEGTQAA